MTKHAAAGQKKISLTCNLAAGASDHQTANFICAALAKHIKSDLGIDVAIGNNADHPLKLLVKPRNKSSMEITVKTSAFNGGPETSQTSILVSNDGAIGEFAIKTLVRPIAKQLGIID